MAARKPQLTASTHSERAVEEIYDELFPVAETEEAEAELANSSVVGRDYRRVSRDLLELWELDPRDDRSEEEVLDMAKTLAADGQDEAIIVRPHPDPQKRDAGMLQILAGGTRWVASAPELANLEELLIDVRDLDDKAALDLAWRTNSKRNPLSALQNARYFFKRRNMEEGGSKDSEASLRAVGKATGYSFGRIRQYVELLTLPPDVLSEFQKLKLNEKHGRGLLDLARFPDAQKRLLREIERDGLSGNGAMTRARRLLEDEATESGEESGESSSSGAADSGAQSSGNADDADFQDDNWKSSTPAQKAGTGGVGSSAPASSGSGFATSSSKGQNLKRGPRKAPPVAGESLAEPLLAIARFYDSGSPVSERFESEVDDAIARVEGALDALKTARASKRRKIEENK